MNIAAWTVRAAGEPMVEMARDERPGQAEVLIEVAGCGVCHTDLAFYYDGVPTRRPFPLTLGHEISGTVVEVGDGAEDWLDARVIVPAVIPCGACAACQSGRGAVCPEQIFPGNDVHGGFATHVRVPSRGLCRVPALDDHRKNPKRVPLEYLAVVADAVSTPYQAIVRSELAAGDLAVFVGAGGVGGFGAQIAAALGAEVIAIDVDVERLAVIGEYGASLTLQPGDPKELRKAVRRFADQRGIPTWRRRIYETSGTAAGQTTAFRLLEHGGYLSVIGFTRDEVTLRLSNLMAFDATVQGNWGCLPEHYPAALDLILSGRLALEPFIECRGLSTINETFEEVRRHRTRRRIILTPGG